MKSPIEMIFSIRSSFKNFYRGIRNIVQYTPLIFNDRDWDEQYMYEMLLFKLKRMHKFFEGEKAISEPAPEVAKEIQEVISMLERVINDDYYPIEYDTSKFFDIVHTEAEGHRITEFQTDWNNEDFKKWTEQNNQAEIQRVEDTKTLFKKIGEKSQGWWD